MIRRIFSATLALCVCPSGLAYEVPTHGTLSEKAVSQSALAIEPTLLQALGLKPFSDSTQKFKNSSEEDQNIPQLVQFGARHEDSTDDEFRPLNHFFDPQHLGIGLWGVAGKPSPTWILDGLGQESEFSYRKAGAHLVSALTGATKVGRNSHWGLVFQNLGHVIHHIQDMAQPEHVRDDPHVNRDEIEDDFLQAAALIVNDPSYYERYTDGDGRATWLDLAAQAGPDISFGTAREFWSNSSRTGIADFTSRNFVSKDTNFGYFFGGVFRDWMYPLPVPAEPIPMSRVRLDDPALGLSNGQQLCEALRTQRDAGEIHVPTGTECEIEFVATAVENAWPGVEAAINPRASSLSLFDAELTKYGKTYKQNYGPRNNNEYHVAERLFTLNRFNFDSGYQFLVPRAVCYSAGLINHFFRGRMELGSAEAENGQIRIEIKNTSEAGNAFGPGRFTMYYDSHDGTRKPLAIDDGADLGAGQFAPGGTHVLLVAPPEDLDLKQLKPFTLVYEGAIGQEKGVAGFVFGAEVRSGLLVNSDTLPSDGVSGPRLIYKLNGQWKLHPQGGFAGGNIDWKGHYVNGIPKKVLTWRGSQRYFGPGSFYSEIYQGGRLFSVAPGPVLGAAIRRDSAGREWLLAICNSGAGDTVYTRPNTYNLSSALFDPETAPEGWREIAFFPNPSGTLVADRAWHFNGDGTEAQTMRRLVLPADSPSNLHSLTRLRMTVSEQSASMTDMGNTVVTRKTTGTETESRCGSNGAIYHTLERNIRTVTSGESIIAVDYLDSTEILAKFKVNDEEVGSESGSGGEDGLTPQLTASTSASRDRALQIGSFKTQLEKSTVDYKITADGESLARTLTVSKAYASQFGLDLRTASVGNALSVENTTEERIADGYTGSDRLDKNVSLDVQLHHKGGLNSLYSGVVETRHVSTPINRRFDEFDHLVYCDYDRTTDLSREILFTSDVAEWTSQRSVEEYSAAGTLAIDRDSNLLASYSVIKNDRSEPARGAFLTDGNIFAILGVPDSSRIYFIAPN